MILPTRKSCQLTKQELATWSPSHVQEARSGRQKPALPRLHMSRIRWAGSQSVSIPRLFVSFDRAMFMLTVHTPCRS